MLNSLIVAVSQVMSPVDHNLQANARARLPKDLVTSLDSLLLREVESGDLCGS